MSYNTRRTGASPGGRAAPTTQVNYHQQPASRGASNMTQARNPGYTTTQQQANYNSATQPGYQTQPAYSSAPPVPPPPIQNKPVQHQPPAAALAPQPQPVIKQPAMPALKQEPVMPVDTLKMDTTENGDGVVPKLPFWKKRPFVKVSNKVKKARQNAKLRRILNPKNAIMFLNELKPGGVKFIVQEEQGWGFVATVDINGKSFSGHGLTNSKAKVQASEQALKHILLEQLAKTQSANPSADKEDNKEIKDAIEKMSTDSPEEGDEPSSKRAKTDYPEDDVPWGSLAAFALHKLFAEWQKDDTGVTAPTEKYDEETDEDYFTRRPGPPPEFGFPRRFPPAPFGRGRGFPPFPPRGPPPPGFGMPRRPPPQVTTTFLGGQRPALPLGGNVASTVLPMKKIPEDANKRHPVMLLNQLKPNVQYHETSQGEAPNVFFNISVEIDGKQYSGIGKSKKEAKKNAAKAALAPLGIIYPNES